MSKENKTSDKQENGNDFIADVSDSFSIIVFNKNENRPATSKEIDLLVNGDENNDSQLFLAWNAIAVSESEKGQLHLHIDSAEEDNYEIRYVSNYR